MTSRIHRPEHKHPQPYQQDLNPDASKGMNRGLAGTHPEGVSVATLQDWEVDAGQPGSGALSKLAQALGVAEAELAAGLAEAQVTRGGRIASAPREKP